VTAHFYAQFACSPGIAGATEAERRSFLNLLPEPSPAHTRWDVAWVEPRFRIGVQSMIGFDAVVGGLPRRAQAAPFWANRRWLDQAHLLGAGQSGRVGLGSLPTRRRSHEGESSSAGVLRAVQALRNAIGPAS
jgi:hypothetical protein